MFQLLAAPLNHPRGNQSQSVSDFLLLEYACQHLGPFETAYALSVIVPYAVELLLPLPNLSLESLQRVHRAPKACHFHEEQLVPYTFQRLVHLLPPGVVAEEVAALFVRVLGRVTVVEIGGSVDFT